MFVDHFSGGLGANDYGPPNVTFVAPAATEANHRLNRSTTVTQLINFTVDDTDSTGLNLTANNSINVTITLGGSQVAHFSFLNVSTTNLTCTSADTVSTQNTTRITCNVTYGFNSNGTYLINITGRDTSNNSNAMNTTSNYIYFTVDQIPPIFVYYNFTNSSAFNTVGGADSGVYGLGVGGGASSAQGGGVSGTIYAVANWTDNLTDPRYGILQFYNTSATAWHTINTTAVNGSEFMSGGWTNLSFAIPQGHNEFEGKNVSFRIIANDTVGNTGNINQTFSITNAASSLKNFTIQINDTTVPTLLVTVTGHTHLNGTNTSDTTPTIFWNVTENTALTNISIKIDASTSDDEACNLHKKFATATTANANRNGSITVLDTGGCTALSNAVHTVRLTAQDAWGNVELYIHSFTIETGTPAITLKAFSNNHTSPSFPVGLAAVNQSNITPYTGINFSAVGGGAAAVMEDFSWTSSCNAAGETVSSSVANFVTSNSSAIWPFNFSGCKGTEANQTVSVTVADAVGNSVTNLFRFAVDDLGPILNVHSPLPGATFTNKVTEINVSALDGMSRVESIVYYLDGSEVATSHTTNGTITAAQGQNSSIWNMTVNFTAGTHTIKIGVNDSLGNARNSSVITFTQTGPIPAANTINTSTNTYLSRLYNNSGITFNTTIRLKDSGGVYRDLGTNTTDSKQTYEIFFNTNSSSANDQINITITEINGSGVNWNKINFSVFLNNSLDRANIQNNWTNTIVYYVSFNNSIDEFTNNNSNYYGSVLLPTNVSGGLEIWCLSNESNLQSRTNISQCTAAFTATTATPCFNFTSGGKTIVQVPHFSTVIAVNDSGAPTITVNKPDGNQSVSIFVPNITVTSDTVSCKYQINNTSPTLSDNQSMNIVTIGADKFCAGQTERLKNLQTTNGIGYNITFFATDSNGNERTGALQLNVSDNAAPNNGIVTSSGTTTGATITIT